MDNLQRDEAPGSTFQKRCLKIAHLPKSCALIPFVLISIAILAWCNQDLVIGGINLLDTNVPRTTAANGLRKTESTISQHSIESSRELSHSQHAPVFSSKGGFAESDGTRQEQTRPTFYFHFGPKKTGTTTIQNTFETSRELLHSSTSYRYVGRVNLGRVAKDMPGLYTAEILETSRGTKELSSVVLSHLSKGRSPIFSSERISTMLYKSDDEKEKPRIANVQSLVDSVRKKGWQVKPIVGYRRLFSWVPSYHAQRVFRFHDPQCRMSMIKWFDQHDAIWECTSKESFVDQHPTQMLVDKLNSQLGLDDVAIVNMHRMKPEDRGDIFHQVVREVLPGVGSFLKDFDKKYSLELANTSTAKIPNYYHLVTAFAIAEGIENQSIQKIQEAASKLHRKSAEIAKMFGGEDNIPTHCFSDDQLKKLLKMSLKFEKELFPEWFAMDGTELGHRNEFQEAIDNGKFCEWDVEMMLKKKELRDLVKKTFKHQKELYW
uniref:Sulfotransferase domain-containing protein n=1 Tax=Chaetoceros debilis TaxID=122233 RepID=A0A7S3QE44_9STRA